MWITISLSHSLFLGKLRLDFDHAEAEPQVLRRLKVGVARADVVVWGERPPIEVVLEVDLGEVGGVLEREGECARDRP